MDESILKVLSEYEEHRLKANIKEGKTIYLAKAVFPLEAFDTSLAELTKIIKTKGELISTLPTSSNVPDGFIGFNLMFGSTGSHDEVKKDVAFDVDVLVGPKNAGQPGPQPDSHLLRSTTTTVRVDIEKLDRILNTVGELSLAKEAVKRIGSELVDLYGHSALVYDIHKISQTFERRLAELQDQVLWTGYVPNHEVSAAFKSSDVCALPFADGASFRRGSLMAALTHGVAIVSTYPQVPLPEIVDRENMLLVPQRDVDALVRAIRELVADPALRQRLEAGAEQLSRLFDWEGIADRTLELYRQVLATHRPNRGAAQAGKDAL